jgi:serine phosphatase RsbU (regulator of sigma subunit)
VCAGSPLLVLDDADAGGLGTYAAAGALTGEAGLPLGLLAVGRDDAPYAAEELEALAALCRLTAQRLRSCAGRPCLMEDCAAQAEIADRLQRRLLPSGPPRLEGVDVAFSYRSASVGVLSGGDFLDFYSRSPSTLAFAIGDVAGKGVDAMAVTFVTKYVLRAAVLGGQLSWPTHPGEALQELRTALLEQPDFGDDPERFVTVLFGTLNTPRGLLQMASAGHPTPFLVRSGGVERPLLLTEPAVGVELGAALAPYPTESVDLRRGDVVVLFTDGLAEMRDVHGEFFEDHMAAALRDCHDRPAEEVVERLLAAGRRFSAGVPADDVAVLCIRVTGGPVD